jgi:alpha-tubulin suppressor-like RCC1 family protein
VIAVAAGHAHSLALKSDGTVWAWGANGLGELGDGTNTQRSTPVQVVGLSGVTEIAAGREFSLAIQGGGASAGTVWAWGSNATGQLGEGSTLNRNVPVLVLRLADVTAVAASDGWAMALRGDGTVWAWGTNAFGNLGPGVAGGAIARVPVGVPPLERVAMISAGRWHALAVHSDGWLWGWGYDNQQLGPRTMQGAGSAKVLALRAWRRRGG